MTRDELQDLAGCCREHRALMDGWKCKSCADILIKLLNDSRREAIEASQKFGHEVLEYYDLSEIVVMRARKFLDSQHKMNGVLLEKALTDFYAKFCPESVWRNRNTLSKALLPSQRTECGQAEGESK